jgi:hypothetical protein
MIAHLPARVSPPGWSISIAANGGRRLSPAAGRSLVILAHAIEYVTDEFNYQYGESSRCDAGLLEAVQLLKRTNRRVYYERPVFPPVRDRIRSFVRAHNCDRGKDWISALRQMSPTAKRHVRGS